MDEGFEKRFKAAVYKGLTDEMIAEQMDLSLAEVQEYKRRLFPDAEEDPEAPSA